MSNRLNIYACSGIGAAEDSYSYWTGGTLSQSNSQAVNNMLAKINLEYVKITSLELSDEEALRCLDNIDLYSVCMYYAREYSNNEFELHHVGQVIGELVKANTFESNLFTDEERGAHLDELFDIVDKAMESPVHEDAVFMGWWKENVEDLNTVGLSQQQQQDITRSLVGDIVGDVDYGNADLNKYLNNAGEYFLYTFFTDAQLQQMPKVFGRKAKLQKQTYQYCASLYAKMNGTQSSMDEIIQAGIIATFGKTPEEVTSALYEQNQKEGRVSLEPATISAIITAVVTVVSVVASLIAKILQIVKEQKIAEARSIDEVALGNAGPAGTDMSTFEAYKSVVKKDNTLLIAGAAILAALLLFRK